MMDVMDREQARDMMAATNTVDEFAEVFGKRSRVDSLHLPFVSWSDRNISFLHYNRAKKRKKS